MPEPNWVFMYDASDNEYFLGPEEFAAQGYWESFFDNNINAIEVFTRLAPWAT